MSRKRTMSLKKKVVLSVVTGAMVTGGAIVTMATGNAAAPDVVCPGSTVTLSGEGGAPAASSGTFPVGTKLKVTNLDNGQSTTVAVNGPSGSCVLLNNAAFDKVREPGKNLIRRARIERVGGGDAPAGAAGAAGANGAAGVQVPPATGDVVCPGSTVTLSGEGGAPAASSGTFPVGTKLKVTNLDNGQSTTVAVNGPSGSCVLLNNAAFDKVREPGKNLIRRARIERVG
ncbi:septal ring lytic transglycosylase RlpA family protein [Streptomyces sp. NBC_01205]|nr:septal ring lytic transglycosylase RlpA family protein [Streptomyces sp. NBC_01205]